MLINVKENNYKKKKKNEDGEEYGEIVKEDLVRNK